MRFRDWNPDLKIARARGVRIEYSSLRNEVVCPELKLSSRDRNQDSGSPPRLTSSGVSGTYGGSASSGSSGDSASASTKRESEKTSSESEKGSTKSGKSEKIKK